MSTCSVLRTSPIIALDMQPCCIDRAYIVHETNVWEGGVGTTYSTQSLQTCLSRAAHSGEPPAVRQFVFLTIALHEEGGELNLFTFELSHSPCV